MYRRHSVFLCICIALNVLGANAIPPINGEQAAALVESKTGPLTNAAAEPTTVHTHRALSISGTGKDGNVLAIVDLQASRVVSIRTAGHESYTWNGVIAVGHRGTLKFAPENTLAAFNKAIELGADLLEMDVRETKDGQLVIMHDASLNRTTTKTGAISDLTLDEIKSADAGSKFASANAGERVPTFPEVLKAIEGRALPDIDFKAGDPAKVVDAVRAAGLTGKVTLYCGDWDKLHKTLSLENGFLIRPTAPMGLEGLEKVLKEFDPPIVNIDWVNFSDELVRAIHLAGKLAFVNMMGKEDNEVGMVRAIDAGADYVQSDRLDILLPLLRERGIHR